MPVSVEHKDSIIWIQLSDLISGQDILDGMATVNALEDELEITPSRICDITASAKIKFGFVDIYWLASLRRTKRFKNRFKSALVARTKSHLGFARMFQTLNHNPQIELQIFPDIESALGWISAGQ